MNIKAMSYSLRFIRPDSDSGNDYRFKSGSRFSDRYRGCLHPKVQEAVGLNNAMLRPTVCGPQSG
jgi:hypothetical protein